MARSRDPVTKRLEGHCHDMSVVPLVVLVPFSISEKSDGHSIDRWVRTIAREKRSNSLLALTTAMCTNNNSIERSL